MKPGYKALIGLLLFALLGAIPTLKAQEGLDPGFMKFEKVFWGPVALRIPIHNHRSDSARLDIETTLLYHDHYLSGLERFNADTTIIVPPDFNDAYRVYVQIQPSYGMAVVRVTLFWEYFNPAPDEAPAEEISQLFRSQLKVPAGASAYLNENYSAGPVYSLLNQVTFNLDLGRVYMFEMGRSESRSDLAKAFEIEPDYLQKLHEQLVEDGMFPIPGKTYKPGVVSIKEEEAMVIKKLLDGKGLALFRRWYESDGKKNIDMYMNYAGIDEKAGNMPALRLAVLLSLFGKNWIETNNDYQVMEFNDKIFDLGVYRRPLWVVEGGEYYIPPFCHAAFEEGGITYMTTFKPNPELPYEKATIYDMRKAVEEKGPMAPVVTAEQIHQMIAMARQDESTKEFSKSFKELIMFVRPEVKKFETHQIPYLVDYVLRYILGAYFVEHQVDQNKLDCVRVEY